MKPVLLSGTIYRLTKVRVPFAQEQTLFHVTIMFFVLKSEEFLRILFQI